MQDLFYNSDNNKNRKIKFKITEKNKDKIRNTIVVVFLILFAIITSVIYLMYINKKENIPQDKKYDEIMKNISIKEIIDADGLKKIEKIYDGTYKQNIEVTYNDEEVAKKISSLFSGITLSEFKLMVETENGIDENSVKITKIIPRLLYKSNEVFKAEIVKKQKEENQTEGVNTLGIYVPELFKEVLVLDLQNIEKFANRIIQTSNWEITEATNFRNMIDNAKKAEENRVKLSEEVEGIAETIEAKLKEELKNVDKQMRIDNNVPIIYRDNKVRANIIQIKIKTSEYKDILSRVENKVFAEIENPESKYEMLRMFLDITGKTQIETAEKINLNTNIELKPVTNTVETPQIQNSLDYLPGSDTQNLSEETNANTPNEQIDTTDYTVIKIYSVLEGGILNSKPENFKIEILGKKGNHGEEKLKTEIELYNESENIVSLAINNKSNNKKIIIKKEILDKEVVTKIENTALVKTGVEQQDNLGKYIEFRRTKDIEKNDNIKYELKVNENKKSNESQGNYNKSINIDVNVEKKKDNKIEIEKKSEIILNEFTKEQIDQMMGIIVFPEVKKILLQKIFQIQNIGTVNSVVNTNNNTINTNTVENNGANNTVNNAENNTISTN